VNVVRTTITGVLNGMGIFYDRKYDIEGPTFLRGEIGLSSSHTMALEEVRPDQQSLTWAAEKACFARKLKEKDAVSMV